MKTLLKIFGIFFLLIFTLIVGIKVYLKYVLTDEKIKEKIIVLVENAIPGGQLTMGKFEIIRGLSLNVKMEEIFLSTRGTPSRENSLLYSKGISILLPLISIWDISPEIYIEGDQLEIRDFPSTGEKKEDSPPAEKKPDKAPSTFVEKLVNRAEKFGDKLLGNSTFNFKSKDLSYFNITQSEKVDLVKCNQVILQFKNISIPLSYDLKCQAEFGEFKSPDISARGELYLDKKDILGISGDVVLKNIGGPPFLGSIPDIEAKVKGGIIKGEFKSSIEATMGYWGHTYLDLNTSSGEVSLDSIKWKMDFSTIGEYIKDMPIKKKGEVDISGGLKFSKTGLVPNLFLKLNDAFLVLGKEKIPLSLLGEIRKGDFNLKVNANLFKGKIDSNISGKVDWGNIPDSFGPINVDMKISSLILKLPPPEEEKTSNKNWLPVIPIDLKFDLKDVMVEKIKVEGSGNIQTRKGALNANLNLFLSDAPLKVKINQQDKNQAANIDVDLKNFNMSLLEGITSPKLGVISGSADASIHGSSSLPVFKSQDYSFKVKFSSKMGTYNNSYIANNWEEFIKENPGLERYISKESKDNVDYREIHFMGELEFKKIEINKFLLNALEDKLIITAKGNLFLDNRNSLVYMGLRDKMGITPSGIKNLLGMGNLHFKLQGPGTKLKPDLLYTSSKMVGESAKSATDMILSPVDLILSPITKPKKENNGKN